MTTTIDPTLPSVDRADPFLSEQVRLRQLQSAVEDAAVAELAELSSHLAAATARLVELVWQQRELFGEAVSPWIAYRCGLPGREAAELLRVAEALRELPLIRAAFGRGELTYAKVRALSRIATAATEEGLLELAGALTANQLERALRVYRRVTASEAARTHELEEVRWWFAEDGSLMLRARLAAEDGAIVVTALEAARDRVLEQRRQERAAVEATGAAGTGGGDGDRDDGAVATDPHGVDPHSVDPHSVPPGAGRSTRVEALVDLARAALAADPPSDAPPARLVVHVDANALLGDGQGCCELEGGPVISRETARRLGCDADVVAQVSLDGLPVSLGRARRTASPVMRRLLRARDGDTCRFPGCERRRHLDAHHRVHWIAGGPTDLANLVLLCFHHHRLVHEGGYSVEDAPDGGLVFRNRSGLAIATRPPAPPPGSLDRILLEHARQGLAIGPDTNRHGRQDGIGRFDIELTLSAVHAIHERAAATATGPPDDCGLAARLGDLPPPG